MNCKEEEKLESSRRLGQLVSLNNMPKSESQREKYQPGTVVGNDTKEEMERSLKMVWGNCDKKIRTFGQSLAAYLPDMLFNT